MLQNSLGQLNIAVLDSISWTTIHKKNVSKSEKSPKRGGGISAKNLQDLNLKCSAWKYLILHL